jgi:hypothetical protein
LAIFNTYNQFILPQSFHKSENCKLQEYSLQLSSMQEHKDIFNHYFNHLACSTFKLSQLAILQKRSPSIFFSWVGLSPLGTAATSGLFYQPHMIDEGDCGAIGGMKIGRGNRSARRKPARAPLCPPQIPHDQTRARTRAAAVGSQRLTAWAMARPRHPLLLSLYCKRYRPPVRNQADSPHSEWIISFLLNYTRTKQLP